MATHRLIGVAPDDAPNAPLKAVAVSATIDVRRHWLEVAMDLAPYIPDGWHLVAMSVDEKTPKFKVH